MFKSMSIRQKFFGFGGLMAAAAFAIGAIGYWGIVSEAEDLGKVTVTSLALRNHMEGDMMHDALRADVINALHAALTDKDALVQIRTDLDDHVKNFRDHIDANKALSLSADVEAALGSVDTKLDAYIKSAQSMVDLAGQDSAAAEKEFPNFIKAFEELEVALGNISDQIEASATGAKEAAAAAASRDRNILIVTFLLAFAAMVAAVFWMVRAICTPLNAMTGAMGTLASGNTSVEIPARNRTDEIGNMAAAMQVFKDNAIRADQMAAEQAKEHEAKTRRAAALEQRASSFDRSVSQALKTVTSAATEMQASAAALSATAEQTSKQATVVSAASEEATSSVQTVAAATE
ncbi:MAG TPA: methyl-accepting chemotaxis protein, partial [Dongiaceae bacterium]